MPTVQTIKLNLKCSKIIVDLNQLPDTEQNICNFNKCYMIGSYIVVWILEVALQSSLADTNKRQTLVSMVKHKDRFRIMYYNARVFGAG